MKHPRSCYNLPPTCIPHSPQDVSR